MRKGLAWFSALVLVLLLVWGARLPAQVFAGEHSTKAPLEVAASTQVFAQAEPDTEKEAADTQEETDDLSSPEEPEAQPPAAPQGFTLLVDPAGNARLSLGHSDSDTIEGLQEGSLEKLVNLATGMATVQGLFVIDEWLNTSQGALYIDVQKDNALAVGEGLLDLSSLGDSLPVIKGTLEAVQDASQSWSTTDFNAEIPRPKGGDDLDQSEVEIASINLGGTFRTDYKVAEFNGNFNASGPVINQAMFGEFAVSIAESGDETTFTVHMAGGPDAFFAEVVQDLAASPEEVKREITEDLQKAQLEVSKFTLTNVKYDPQTANADITIGVMKLRQSLKNIVRLGVAALVMQMSAPVETQPMYDALDQMMESRLDSLSVELKAEGNTLSGRFGTRISNVNQLFLGYIKLAAALQEMAPAIRQAVAAQGEDNPLDVIDDSVIGKLQLAGNRATFKNMEVLINTALEAGLEASGEFTLNYKDNGTLINAGLNGKVNTKNFAAYYKAAAKAGAELPDASHLNFSITPEGKTHKLVLYADYIDPWFDNEKAGFKEIAAQVQGAQELVDLMNKVDFKGLRLLFTAADRKINLAGDLQAPGSGQLLNKIVSMIFPEFKGSMTGMAFKFTGNQEENRVDLSANFSGLDPKLDQTGVRKIFGKLMEGETVEVRLNASSTETAPPEVKPLTITIPANLARIRTEMQAKYGKPAVAGKPWAIWAVAGVLALIVIIVIILLALRKRQEPAGPYRSEVHPPSTPVGDSGSGASASTTSAADTQPLQVTTGSIAEPAPPEYAKPPAHFIVEPARPPLTATDLPPAEEVPPTRAETAPAEETPASPAQVDNLDPAVSAPVSGSEASPAAEEAGGEVALFGPVDEKGPADSEAPPLTDRS